MERVTGYNLVAFINQLPKNRNYNYINPTTTGLIRIVGIVMPEGPIKIRRWNPAKGETYDTSSAVTISSDMIWRVANALFDSQPTNIDRLLGASYNTRSVLESLLAHTPQFYFCYPGRIFDIAGRSTIEQGHKHIIWLPNEPHENGKLVEKKTEVAISEIPASAAVYEALQLPSAFDTGSLTLEQARRHTQIQVALYLIGLQLGYRTWIAQNDKGILYHEKPLIEQTGIVQDLATEKLVGPFDGAVNAGLYIDCIWFRNAKFMPAVMEVEHTTGVTSGLTRMRNFKDAIPPIQSRYVIVAPDEDRSHVIKEANKPMFKELNTQYFPYSSVEELYVICQRRKLRGITDDFLDCYMEPIIQPS
jgi:type II restriction enzyme